MTIEELKQYLCENDYEESVLFENPDYISAVVGISEEGRVIYSFDKMVDYLIVVDGMDPEDACDFISYNTLRALPYAGEKAPIVMYGIE